MSMEQTAGHLNALLSTDSSCWPIPEHRKLSRGMDHSKFKDNMYCIARLHFKTNKSQVERHSPAVLALGRWNLGYIQRLDLKSK